MKRVVFFGLGKGARGGGISKARGVDDFYIIVFRPATDQTVNRTLEETVSDKRVETANDDTKCFSGAT